MSKNFTIDSSPLSSVSSNKEVNKHGKGRKCPYPNCITKLSLYNQSKYCMAHQLKGSLLEDEKNKTKNPYLH